MAHGPTEVFSPCASEWNNGRPRPLCPSSSRPPLVLFSAETTKYNLINAPVEPLKAPANLFVNKTLVRNELRTRCVKEAAFR